jgi:hypothetical protein
MKRSRSRDSRSQVNALVCRAGTARHASRHPMQPSMRPTRLRIRTCVAVPTSACLRAGHLRDSPPLPLAPRMGAGGRISAGPWTARSSARGHGRPSAEARDADRGAQAWRAKRA